MRSIVIFILCISAFANAATTPRPSVSYNRGLNSLKPGRCLLEVGGKKYISGACRIEIDKGGSFRIYDLKKRGYFAYVEVDGSTAEGYWNEELGATHAHSPLGTLTRDGACWANEQAKVCAWA